MAPLRFDNDSSLIKIEPDFNGYWGNLTSTINWCEAKYEVNYYFVEFWNTISNLAMIIPPTLAAIFAWIDNFETRYIFGFLCLSAVGIGSWLFHMTLMYEMQLMDELPMLYGTLVFIFNLWHTDKNKVNNQVTVGLIVYGILSTIIYLVFPDPAVHQVAYAILVVLMTILSIRLHTFINISPLMYYCCIFSYVFGFLLWQIDVRMCYHLKLYRKTIGYPLKPLLQFHAWWHVFAGSGTFFAIVYSLIARQKFLHIDTKFKVHFFWIYLRRRFSKKLL